MPLSWQLRRHLFNPFGSGQARPCLRWVLLAALALFTHDGFYVIVWIGFSILILPPNGDQPVSNIRKKTQRSRKISKWFKCVGGSERCQVFKSGPPPLHPLWASGPFCKFTMATSIVFLAVLQCKRRGKETKRQLCNYWVTLMGKIKRLKKRDKQKTWVSGPMNRQLYLQGGFTIYRFKVHILELDHHEDPIIANFWGKSSLPFSPDCCLMQKGFPVFIA